MKQKGLKLRQCVISLQTTNFDIQCIAINEIIRNRHLLLILLFLLAGYFQATAHGSNSVMKKNGSYYEEHQEEMGITHDSCHLLSPEEIMAAEERPDLKIEGSFDYDPATETGIMTLVISNIGNTFISAGTEIKFYVNVPAYVAQIGGGSALSTIGGKSVPTTIGKDLWPGESMEMIFDNIRNQGVTLGLHYTYIVRLMDAGFDENNTDLFTYSEKYTDVDWTNNRVDLGLYVLRSSVITAIPYGEFVADLFENDDYPHDFVPILTEQYQSDAGYAYISTGKYNLDHEIINNKLRVKGPAEVNDEIIEFQYTVQLPTGPISTFQKGNSVYFYVVQSAGDGFSTCAGSGYYQPELKKIPEFILFEWFDEEGNSLGMEAPVIEKKAGEYNYYVRPVFSQIPFESKLRNLKITEFPKTRVTLTVFPDGKDRYVAKWKGIKDTNWHNPENWVRIDDNGLEIPVTWTPKSCVDVILPSGCPHYPELTREVGCYNIKLENGAMIAGIHYLNYHSAEVELKLLASEKERFVMTSAPLKNMYTGDYHFRLNEKGNPIWGGDVYMNFFQAENPDVTNSVEVENAFTATFGHVGVELPLGQGFNIRVENRDMDATFRFPKEFTQYTGEDGVVRKNLDRTEAGRFIIDQTDLDENGSLMMPVQGDNNFAMIQVVNPFMAYLDMAEFMKANSDLAPGYKIWDGKMDGNFVSVIVKELNGERELHYYIEDPEAIDWKIDGLVPPLQSFIVMKKNKKPLTELKISSAWTTTNINQALRTATPRVSTEGNLLRITAYTLTGKSSTLLYNEEGTVSGYKATEDFLKLVNKDSSLELYTIASTGEALSFNASDDYSRNVPLGIRMAKTDILELEFEGVKTFGYDIYLLDHADGDKIYDLNIRNFLSIGIDTHSTDEELLDLSGRFSLLFAPQDTSVGNEPIPEADQDLLVIPGKGYLNVSARGREITNLQVYNLQGQLLYQLATLSTHYHIPSQPGTLYIVKGEVNNKLQIIKVIGK